MLDPSVPLDVVTATDRRAAAAFRLGDDQLADDVVLDVNAFDWREEDEPIVAHDPFHRIDVRRSWSPGPHTRHAPTRAAPRSTPLGSTSASSLDTAWGYEDPLEDARDLSRHAYADTRGETVGLNAWSAARETSSPGPDPVLRDVHGLL